jgi:hypothetical protein
VLHHKLGRRPAVHNLRTMRSAIAMHTALASLGTAPTVTDDYVTPLQKALAALATPVTGGAFGMFLNGPGDPPLTGVPAEGLGDCVCADSCHQLMLHSANAGTIVVPSDQDCLSLYEAVGGYQPGNASTDQGCDETSMEAYMQSTGLCGVKTAGSGSIDPANLNNLKWGVQIFGAVRLGIVVDEEMEQQFESGEPWTTAADPNDPNAGGHDVPAVYADADGVDVITWGGRQRVMWALMANPQFLSEAHASVWPDFIASTGTAPNGFNLAQLLADLPALQEQGT